MLVDIVATVTSLLILVVVAYGAWHTCRLIWQGSRRLYKWLDDL